MPMFYRVSKEFLGDHPVVEPTGYYEGITEDGEPALSKYGGFWRSEHAETCASKVPEGALMGCFSSNRMTGEEVGEFHLYGIMEQPCVDISHWTGQDFFLLQEVRYRKPVTMEYLGKVVVPEEIARVFRFAYACFGLDEFSEEGDLLDIIGKYPDLYEKTDHQGDYHLEHLLKDTLADLRKKIEEVCNLLGE